MLNGPNAGRWLWIALIALTPLGCTDVLGPEQEALSAARARWAMSNVDNYVFEFQRSCFCAPDFVRPVRIEILNGVVSSAVYVDTEEPLSPPLTSVPTIDDLFDEIRDALNRTAFSVIAAYDVDMGYPTSVSIDYIQNAIDDEMAFMVSSLALLEPSSTSGSSPPRGSSGCGTASPSRTSRPPIELCYASAVS